MDIDMCVCVCAVTVTDGAPHWVLYRLCGRAGLRSGQLRTAQPRDARNGDVNGPSHTQHGPSSTNTQPPKSLQYPPPENLHPPPLILQTNPGPTTLHSHPMV